MDTLFIVSSHLALEIDDIKSNFLDGGKMRLFMNDYTPSNFTALGDLTEAVFTGYTAGGVTLTTWSDYYDVPGNGVATLSPTVTWNAASPFTVTATIYGAYILDVAGALVGAVRFATPKFMGGAGDAIHYAAEFKLMPNV